MTLNRRRVVLASAASAACVLLARHAPAADQEHALFWRASVPGKGSCVLFGYERIAAGLVPDVVTDGDRLVDETQSVTIDMGANVRMPAVFLDRKQTKPIVQILSADLAGQLRSVLAATPASKMIDMLSGFEATVLLLMEGQHAPNPTVGGTIAEHAKAAGRPFAQLISDQELASAWQPPDMPTINAAIGDKQIGYLLDLRREIGPIGAHLEGLYRARQGEEIHRLTTDITSHGVISTSQFLQNDRIRALLLERVFQSLSAGPIPSAFMLIPLGVLTGTDGMLAGLASRGAAVTPVA